MSDSISTKTLFDMFKEKGINLTAEQIKNIGDAFKDTLSYHPKIGVFGKTGAGKSSLCNALFGQDVAAVSDVSGCTRAPQEVLLQLGDGKTLTLVDLPGVGENSDRDSEYKALYKSTLPELDLVLWVIKADDRAFSVDEDLYKNVITPIVSKLNLPFIFVLNQVDKIEPFREWDIDNRKPSEKQQANIEQKIRDIGVMFNANYLRRIPVSANEGYGLVKLVETIISALPPRAKYATFKAVKKENTSEQAKEEAQKGFWDTVWDKTKKILADNAEEIAHIGLVLLKTWLKVGK